jgi:hypothetical protein
MIRGNTMETRFSFPTNSARTTGQQHVKKPINPDRIDLNVKCKTIKLLEHNTRENLYDLKFVDNLSRYVTKGTVIERNNQ